MVITGTAAVIVIILGIVIYVVEFASKTYKSIDKRRGRSTGDIYASPPQTPTEPPAGESSER